MPAVYRSTDAFAPVLNNAAGSLLTLLDACLVTGYGSGEDAKDPAGWSRPFTGTNVAVYRNSAAAGGSEANFRIDDSNGQTARIRAFRTMSDVDTGTDAAPTVAQKASGAALYKNAVASAVDWVVVADGATVWLGIGINLYGFGDIESFIAADSGRYFVAAGSDSRAGGQASSISTPARDRLREWDAETRGLYLGLDEQLLDPGQRFAVPYMAETPSNRFTDDTTNDHGIGGGSAPMAAPEATTNRLFFHDALAVHGGLVRGRLRGLYCPLNDTYPLGLGYEISGESWQPEGSRLITLLAHRPVSTGRGSFAVETGLDWE